MEGGTLLAIPQRCPRTELQSPLPFTLPVQGELLPDGFWVYALHLDAVREVNVLLSDRMMQS
jgi:hypothetical protein